MSETDHPSDAQQSTMPGPVPDESERAADNASAATFRLGGRIRAWLLLLVALIVVFVIAGLLGFFNV
jgi:hypothetical protein